MITPVDNFTVQNILPYCKFRINIKPHQMKKSRQFWQDVELAIGIYLLKENIRQIIIEGRSSRTEINKTIARAPERDRVLFHYHEVMIARFQHHGGHMHHAGI